MKRNMLLVKAFFGVMIFGLFSSCGQREVGEEIVSVSIAPLYYFIDRLTGESLEVNVMVPQGASHGTYSPTARQMQKLSDSQIYFQIPSLGYEQAFIRRLKELNPNILHVDLGNYTQLIRGERIDHGDHFHEGGIDPHLWMSPKVILEVLPGIKNALLEVYPHLSETIENNYSVLKSDVELIHNELQEVVSGLRINSFMIFHPALTYLARDYGLDQISIEHEGKEPSPGRLRQLIQKARNENISVIFVQEEYDVRNAELVAEETGAEVVQINPLAYDWMLEMRNLANAFKTYLK